MSTVIAFVIGLLMGGSVGFLVAACIAAEKRAERYPYDDIYYFEEDDL